MGGLLSGVGFLGGAWLGVRAVSGGINMWLGSLGGRAFLGVGFYGKNLDFYVETDAGGSSRFKNSKPTCYSLTKKATTKSSR